MEYEEHPRMFALNMGEPGVGGHSVTQGLQPNDHSRLLIGGVLENSLVSVGSQMFPLHQISVHQTLHHQHLQQHPSNQPLTPHHQITTGHGHHVIQEPHHSVPDACGHLNGSADGVKDRTVATHPGVAPLGVGLQRSHVDASNSTSVPVQEDLWCAVCNGHLSPGKESVEVLSLGTSVMTISQRRLNAMLRRIVGLSCHHVRSDLVCRKCFSLVEQVDALEIELADTKMDLVKLYEETLKQRQPALKKTVQRPTLEAEVDLEEPIDSDEEMKDNEDEDPTVAPNGMIRKRLSKGRRKRQPRKISKSRNPDKCGSEVKPSNMSGCQSRRSRGRPRKKEKEDEDLIPAGTFTKTCPACNKVVPATRLLSHLALHRLFPCPFCETVHKRKDIKNHVAESHQEEIHFPCTECNKVHDTFVQLLQHCRREHMGIEIERYLCKICNKTFAGTNGLKVHIETMHSKSQVFECPTCKEVFNQRGNMQNHFRRVHQGAAARRLTCDLCSKGFICPSDLRKHIERVHLKIKKHEAVCQYCMKHFSDSRALKIHINAVHTREVEYHCPECKLVFHSFTNMSTHRRRMHKGTEGRKHICAICKKGFCSPSDLKTHLKVVHENVRKYVCDICNQSFKVASHLKYHRRRHTGETPYECPHCYKRFHGPNYISDHIKKVHKMVYMGVNQRRRLNLSEGTAGPPPTGILPAKDSSCKMISGQTDQSISSSVGQVIMESSQTQSSSVASISSMPHVNTNMMPFVHAQANAMAHTTAMIENHSGVHNAYANVQFEQQSHHSQVPMVLRLLHEMPY